MAEQIRQILIDEQDHQIDLATALGEDPPDLHAAKSTKSSWARNWPPFDNGLPPRRGAIPILIGAYPISAVERFARDRV
jgi:hypothetical protein